MLAGRIACDFCKFVGDLEKVETSKGTMRVPAGWVSIHPVVTFHGNRGHNNEISDERRRYQNMMKCKIKEKVLSLHVCPGCTSERNVFDLVLALPQGVQQKRENIFHKGDSNGDSQQRSGS